MSRFATVFFDVDDTLYPPTNGVWQFIGDRINQYMVERLAIPPDRASALRKSYFQHFGTTLHGLIVDYDVDPHDYMAFVHDIPLERMLKPDPQLRATLLALPQKRVIFTNADRNHAERVTRLLGVWELIDLVVDLFALDLHNKPKLEAYRRALALAGDPPPEACVMVDDHLVNLRPAADLGMTTVWVGEGSQHAPADYKIASVTELQASVPELFHGSG